MTALLAAALALPLRAQEGTLDVLDGETLYEQGWLVTLGAEVSERSSLMEGGDSVTDALDREQRDRDLTLAAHYGLRHDLQLSLVIPWVERELDLTAPGLAGELQARGTGDVTALMKWRFHRWDAPHKALNVALIAGLELPFGEDDERDAGLVLPEDLQPGSGSLDPMLGIGVTYEPYRWRFNAALLYKHNGGGGEYDAGDEVFAELAVGNRFWLEPYPGPFMRADLLLRYRRQDRFTTAAPAGAPAAALPLYGVDGGDVTTVGLNWAFRPRPSLDFQLALEAPIDEHSEGDKLAEEPTVSLTVGYRF
jgi:hypothetical protein